MHVSKHFSARLISLIVATHAAIIMIDSLIDQLTVRHAMHVSELLFDVHLLIGLSLLYLASLLRRRKYTALQAALVVYIFYLGFSLAPLVSDADQGRLTVLKFAGNVLLPAVVLGLLATFRAEFIVRSDRQGFRTAFRFSIVVLAFALLYGVTGYSLLDKHDYHQEIGFATAVHYTIDQFGLTTNSALHPYTRRAHLFNDSLSLVSSVAVLYAVLSFFQPLRLRLADQSENRQRLEALLRRYGAASEDFFKLWPHDKQYYFDADGRSALAYHVWRGVAVCLGDPAGDAKRFAKLLDSFADQCYRNDWQPLLVHIQETHRDLYERRGYSLQKLGQEAVVDIDHFQSDVARNKYFRHITNKFTKQGCTAELLQPPHHDAVIQRLRTISDNWLERGGHTERGFAMGYFSAPYMQQCAVMVVRDAAGTIQAFANLIPADFDSEEATYDLLRQTSDSMGNINDFLMLNFITELQQLGYGRLNMGLCPLTGLDEPENETNLIHNVLRLAYANGDRFYSFSGLYRFKSKYEPQWRDRYVAYQGGVRGFTRGMTALMRSMRRR